ncbi:uncharacterized protein PADG_00339 [Paracoccidioides brasiliensis Pb18]|uniref:Uncharacterized protein n=1 Tax=Paracoccidioides brasiliensis (strain Pb18) TaxID=502780 RepID=C1G0E9_PARBD|nr:uncharacterized protein PADG_00339 [Paracoccidioides brasiliensis Pb18]EEH44050.2 hypothetical protein PADG_00339 [Paracoccidioides brasiliensis Pb18]
MSYPQSFRIQTLVQTVCVIKSSLSDQEVIQLEGCNCSSHFLDQFGQPNHSQARFAAPTRSPAEQPCYLAIPALNIWTDGPSVIPRQLLVLKHATSGFQHSSSHSRTSPTWRTGVNRGLLAPLYDLTLTHTEKMITPNPDVIEGYFDAVSGCFFFEIPRDYVAWMGFLEPLVGELARMTRFWADFKVRECLGCEDPPKLKLMSWRDGE